MTGARSVKRVMYNVVRTPATPIFEYRNSKRLQNSDDINPRRSELFQLKNWNSFRVWCLEFRISLKRFECPFSILHTPYFGRLQS